MIRENILKAEGLCKSYYGREIVKNVYFQVARGEVVGLLGPNGAGKTTSFYIVAGLIQADKGKVFLLGRDVTALPIYHRAASGLGYLPQDRSIFRDLSVEENIRLVLENRKISSHKRVDILQKLMESFGLDNIRHSIGSTLSGGECRRVEIARTLALNPKFVLLDEPFAGIDPLSVCDVQEIVKDLKKKNIGVLITDHNVREMLGVVDRAYIMNEGEILLGGNPQEIVEDSRVRKFYLGESFKI